MMEPDRREFLAIAAAGVAVAAIPADILAHCDLTDNFTKAIFAYANLIIYDP